MRVMILGGDGYLGYPSATVWRGRPGIRLSVSNWRTDTDDVAVVAAAFADALRATR